MTHRYIALTMTHRYMAHHYVSSPLFDDVTRHTSHAPQTCIVKTRPLPPLPSPASAMNVLYIVSDDARPEMPSFGPVENQWSVPFETKNLLENTDGGVLRHPRFGASHSCSLGTAACYLLVMLLTRTVLMPSLFQKARLREGS